MTTDEALPESSRRPGLVSTSSESTTVADESARVLSEHGIEHVFHIPGGPVMPLVMAIHRSGRFQSVLAAHEVGAVLMSEGYYRATLRLAVAVLTAGPAALNAVAGAGLALRELSGLLIITAQVPRIHLGKGAAQEFDTVAALAPVCKKSVELQHPARIGDTLHELVEVACSGRPGPTHLSVAADDWLAPISRGRAYRPPTRFRLFDGQNVGVAARALARAKTPVVLLGYGAVLARAADVALELARWLPHARFVCSPRAKGVFPEDHPQSAGVFGFAASPETIELVEASDTVLVVGSRLGEITTAGWSPALLGKFSIQIDQHVPELGRVYPADVHLAGDARSLVGAIARALAENQKKEGAYRETA
jgi:acetolactate synthase-1/2/3 large subunit